MSQDGKNNIWTNIQTLIDRIFTFQTVSTSCRMTVHTNIYDHLLAVRRIPDGIPDRIRPFRVQTEFSGADVYHHIKFCLQDKIELIVQNMEGMADNDALRSYEKYWSRYKSMCTKLGNTCFYVNRHWVARECNAGRQDIPTIDLMSQEIWERVFFQPFIPRIVDTCLNMIKSQRDPQTIDSSLLKSAIDILSSPDFNHTMINNSLPSGNVYQTYFEVAFRRYAEDLYCHQTIPYNEADSLMAYLNEVNQYINEEVERVASFLPESTKLLLIDIIEGVFTRHYQPEINKLIKELLDNDQRQELSDLFKSINRMPNTKRILVENLQSLIKKTGMNAIQSIHSIALKEPKVYIDTILDVYANHSAMVRQTFDDDSQLRSAVGKACQYFINHNCLTESEGNKQKSAELLAQYCDILLRKSDNTMSDSDFQKKCQEILFIFNFIDDKDIFEKLYGKMLAKRLINQSSFSDDAENLLVTEFEYICGVGYASKFKQMIIDINISESINKDYRAESQHRPQPIPADFSIMILTNNSWLLTLPPNLALPSEFNIVFDHFFQFYRERYTGRQLRPLYQYSKGELLTYFNQKKYTFQVSMYQMIVLLLFNQSVKWTAEEISNETQMQIDLLMPILNTLIKSKVLLCSEIENENHRDCIIELAADYENKKSQINLNVPIKRSKEKDPQNFHRIVDENRKLIIQAAIVRIMKERKELKYALLMQQVIEQINPQFKPHVPMIKKCIDILIEKDYLERNSEEKEVLRYMP